MILKMWVKVRENGFSPDVTVSRSIGLFGGQVQDLLGFERQRHFHRSRDAFS